MARLRDIALALALLGASAGCASPAPREQTAGPAPASLPAGAIAVGPDLYQVPAGADEGGCEMYRLYSPTRLVGQAIAWRRQGGGFTQDRREADCPG